MVNRKKVCDTYGIIGDSELRELLIREIYENSNVRFIKVSNDRISKEFDDISDFAKYLNDLCFGYSKIQYFSYFSSFGKSANIKLRVCRWMNSFVDILIFDVVFPISSSVIVTEQPSPSPIQEIREKNEKLFNPKFVDFYY